MTAKHHNVTAVAPAASRSGGIDLINEHVVTLADLARRLPSRRNGRPTHVGTIHRWRLRGLRGVKLAAARLGGTWVTSLEAYQRFCDALTRLADHTSPTSAGTTRAAHDRTEQLLDDLGV